MADRPGHDRRYCARHRQAAAARLAPAGPLRRGLRETVAWYRENEWWWRPIKEHDPAFRAYYEAQYGAAPRPDRRRAWSSSGHRRHRLRGQPPARHLLEGRAGGRRLVASAAAATQPRDRRTRPVERRSICSIAGAVARRARGAQPSVIYHCAGIAARRRRLVEARPARCGSTRSARTTCSKAAATAGLDCPVLVIGSALVYRAVARARSAKTIRSVRRIRTASASSRRRCCAASAPATAGVHRRGRSTTPDRGSRRAYVTSSFRAADRRDRGRTARAGAAGRQPRLAPRHHRRPRHRARLSRSWSRRGHAWPSLQRVLGTGLPGARSARHATGAVAALASESRSTPTRLRPSDNPVIAGDRSRIAAETGWRRGFPSSARSRICSTTGARGPAAPIMTPEHRSSEEPGRSSTCRWAGWRSCFDI